MDIDSELEIARGEGMHSNEKLWMFLMRQSPRSSLQCGRDISRGGIPGCQP